MTCCLCAINLSASMKKIAFLVAIIRDVILKHEHKTSLITTKSLLHQDCVARSLWIDNELHHYSISICMYSDNIGLLSGPSNWDMQH